MRRLAPGALAVLLAGCGAEARPLVGRVVDRVTGAPIAGARVVLTGHVAHSDADGRFALPAAPGAVHAAAAGYLDLARTELSGPHATLALRMFPAAIDDAAAHRMHAAEHAAARPAGPGDLRAAAIEAGKPGATSPPTALAVTVPPVIRVWRRRVDGSTDSCAGRVDRIPTEDYTRGVVPHEWIPSWRPASLRAGAVAARTYAARFAAIGGKYDCADVDDTTASQVYTDERVASTDEAVAATAGQVVVKNGQLHNAEYSAENGDPTADGVVEPHCAGRARNGHGRGMCQWGTQRWATNEDRDHTWMIGHYYPGATLQQPGPAFDATYQAQSAPRLEMSSGDRPVAWVEFENRGASAWTVATTRLATTMPRDRQSPFFDAVNWTSPTRPSAPDAECAPAAVCRFSFVLHAPDVDRETTFTEHFGLVDGDATWFGPEDRASLTLVVRPRGAAGAGGAGAGGSGGAGGASGSGGTSGSSGAGGGGAGAGASGSSGAGGAGGAGAGVGGLGGAAGAAGTAGAAKPSSGCAASAGAPSASALVLLGMALFAHRRRRTGP